MPPGMKRPGLGADSPPEDVPEGIPVATQGEARNGPIDSDDDEPVRRKRGKTGDLIPANDDSEPDSEVDANGGNFEMTRISDIPPSLPGIDIGGNIELPSRLPSKASSSRHGDENYVPPSVPRKNPRRVSQGAGIPLAESRQRPTADLYDPDPRIVRHRPQPSTDFARLPFDRTNSKPHSTISARSSIAGLDDPVQGNQSSIIDDSPTSVGHVHHHSIWTVTDHTPGVDLLGSSAEIVNLRPNDGSQHSHETTQR